MDDFRQSDRRRPKSRLAIRARDLRRVWRGGWFLATMISLTAVWFVPCPAEELAPFHIGFSARTFSEVNENDAMAAVRIWSQALAQEGGIPADPQPKILRSMPDIILALTNRMVDCLSLTTEEYASLRPTFALDSFVVARMHNYIAEQYLLLVHRDSGLERLADLRRHKLGVLSTARACLAPMWLETVLAREGLGPSAEFFSQQDPAGKITKVVLPVFFRQLDACLVTRNGFDTMVELNPQIGQRLKVLATSPAVVPVIFCFRADYHSPVRGRILTEITRWHTSPAGRQILTLFQSDSLEECPANCLDSALQLLDACEKLRREPRSSVASSSIIEVDAVKGVGK